MMFAKMGVPNDQLSFFTTLLYFPWFLKFLWSPFVDILRTKRWWIISMQILLTALCVLLTLTLPHPSAETIAEGTSVGIFRWTLIFFIIAAFASATHDIAADGYYMLAHNSRSQANFVGVRSTFYRIAAIFAQGGLVWLAGFFEEHTGNIPLSWQITLGATGVILLLITLYHCFLLPKPEEDKPRVQTNGEPVSGKEVWKELGRSLGTFFTKKGVVIAIIFMLFYRLSEGFLVKLCQPFLVDDRAISLNEHGQFIGGGLGLATGTVGFLYGTIGVIALLLGGVLGGIYIANKGLKRSIWLMAITLTLPSFVYCYLSMAQPENWAIIGTAIGFEQFGYGFGFTAYMMYMMHFSEGKYKTAHYAICTAFMALSMMIPGFMAGALEMAVGYTLFFWIANACSFTTFIVTIFVYKQLKE